jgi:hypothetical protein
MTLARVWTRQLYRAWGVALLGPVTMIAALAVLALGGGFGGLSALGQLVSGPAVPVGSSSPGASPGARTATRLLPVVPASPAAAPAATAARTRVAAVTPRLGRPVGAGGSRSHPGSPGRAGVGSGGGHASAPPVSGPPRTPTQPAPPVTPPSAPPASGPVPALVNQVVAVGVSVTSQLPAPLAAIGTGALESVGQTLNTVLAPLS